MSALHIPVGGARFRPCVEDVIQFLIEECRLDAVPDYGQVLAAGRARWRRTQTKAVVRDFPDEAAGTLRDLGYRVEAQPGEGHGTPERALHHW